MTKKKKSELDEAFDIITKSKKNKPEPTEEEKRLIKIALPINDPDGPSSERVWAKIVGDPKDCLAEIDNLPVHADFGYKDIVRYNPETMIAKEIITRVTCTALFQFDADPDDEERKKQAMILDEYFSKQDIAMQGVARDIMSVAVPYEWTEEQVMECYKNCPLLLIY